MRVRLICLLLCCVFLETGVRAELPPAVYKQYQDGAPEAVRIKVVSVEKKVSETKDQISTHLVAKARVEEVIRTGTGLKSGAEITVIYTRTENRVPMPGPGPIPLLREGLSYQAYLAKGETADTYVPVARGRSFE